MTNIVLISFSQQWYHYSFHSSQSTSDMTSTRQGFTITPSHTFHVLSPAARMYLAARSLCTKDLPARYSMPEAMSLQNRRSTLGKYEGTNSPGLLNMKCVWQQLAYT